MKKILCIVALFTTMVSIAAKTTQKAHKDATVVDLVASTRIVRKLIATNNLADFLENSNPEQLELILNNMSPVQMATEIEIIRSAVPVVACCYESALSQEFNDFVEQLAQKYANKLKFVMIDVDKLIQLQDVFEVDISPTVILFKEGEEIGRVTSDERTLVEQFIAKNM